MIKKFGTERQKKRNRKGKALNGSKVIAELSFMLATILFGLYHISEKIGYVKHDIQKQLIDDLGSRNILADKETDDIIQLISGTISQTDFDELMKKYDQTPDTIDVQTLGGPDHALYNTIREMQSKYGNPTITFGGSHFNLEEFRNEPDRALFDHFGNRIKIHQLNEAHINFRDLGDDERRAMHTPGLERFNEAIPRKRTLINNWIAELAHAKQMKNKGVVKMSLDRVWHYRRSPFNYSKQYHLEGTTEHEAHSVYEPELVQEFIRTYEKYAQHDSSKLFNIVKFYGGFFEKYEDMEKSVAYLEKIAPVSYLATYSLARHYLQLYFEHNDHESGYTAISDTAKQYYSDAIHLFIQAYKLGFVYSGIDLLSTHKQNQSFSGLLNEEILAIGEDLIARYQETLEEKDLWTVCDALSIIYSHSGNHEKSKYYRDLSFNFTPPRIL